MDQSIDNEWLSIKPDHVDEPPVLGNIARSWQWRETGINRPNYPPNKLVLENAAEDLLVQKPLTIRSCDLPGYPRSTFLMVFSPDGTKVASTHGNHNVYVSELASGKHVRILKGHPRTPWCIAFHPSHTQLIGSGCLGGQVRVWDIASGGSEVWNVRNETVIASIAFHPREQLLVIATYNELYFWDWSQPAPFTKVCTNNVNEKVRYVAFDALGHKLITGISLRGTMGSVVANNALLAQTVFSSSSALNRREDGDSPSGSQSGDNSGSAQDMIVNSYQNLVQRYDSLVRNYQRLFMVRNRLNNPPVPTTMDRGTDPMETDLSSDTSTWSRIGPSRQTRQNNADGESSQGPSNSAANAEGETGTRILNLDVLSLENDRSRNQDSTTTERTSFGSRSSAFQPLSEYGRPFGLDQHESPTRLLPNPFSSSNSTPRASRISSLTANRTQRPGSDSANTSRTSIFTSTRSGSISRRVFVFRRRNFSPTRRDLDSSRGDSSTSTESATQPSPPRHTMHHYFPDGESRSISERRRPTMANSSTQMSPTNTPLDAQTLNESLDLIRDILRDSGTRLLNLITDMSLSMLAGSENSPRRGEGARAHSDDGERSRRGRADARAPRQRPRLLSSSWRREFLSSSDSDSDNTLEVNILRTRNSSFREENAQATDRPSTSEQTNTRAFSTDRMVFELSGDTEREASSRESSGVNVSLSNDRFRVRTQSGSGEERPASGTTDEAGPSQRRAPSAPDFSRPSTSRDSFWIRGTGSIPPDEAYRKVSSGISALHKHTLQLVNLSQRRSRTTTRELRVMWENLRRRILTLHRETGRPDVPGYYTRSLLERCMMLAEMSDPTPRTSNRSTRSLQREVGNNRDAERNGDAPSTSRNHSPTDTGRRRDDLLPNSTRHHRLRRSETTNSRSSPDAQTVSSARRRLVVELRRRSRNIATNRLAQRYSNRSRRDFTRAIEINATRHEIRMRAMQVLSVMFNMMMMCLEKRGLSQLIIIMLRTLKKALALTCYMLMSNRNGRPGLNTATNSQPLESMDVVRIQNVVDAGPVNVDDLDESLLSGATHNEETKQDKKHKENKRADFDKRSSSQRCANGNACEVLDLSASSSRFPSQRWSNRLAVQIAAANRNNSATARNRRELYQESKRLKALHRTNPTAHPLIKKRVMPPMSTYRIPHLRNGPNISKTNPLRLVAPRREIQSNEPIPGPSNASAATENSNQEGQRSDGMNEIDERVNVIRIASQGIRNVPRNRFRRLQTIRLYTPSSVREMFALQPNSTDNSQENRSPLQNNPETGTRRPFTVYRPHILTPRSDPASRPEVTSNVHNMLRNLTAGITLPDAPVTVEMPGITVQRIPRIHDYLQPIILAQNAMIVDDEGTGNNGGGGGGNGGGGSGGGGGGGDGGSPGGSGGGGGGGGGPPGPGAGGLGNSLSGLMGGGRRLSGMAGLLDAGIISEALPAPSHRVQAWDFTTGDAPDIADTAKNVVVQRCRIHNDASIDISRDGRLLVALLPVPRLRNTNHWLGVYSLEWSRLGQCLHTAVMEQAAVSVALSPTARHLAVGLGSRRFTTAPHSRNNVFALLYRLEPFEGPSRTGLTPVKELEQNWEHGFTSLNCLRWAPQPGQGLVYANNTGQLIIMS